MKIAVISDIHGNLEALNSVIDDLKKENCDKIFCLGDLAMAGPEPEKTIKTIQELEKSYNLFSIQGNTDEMISNCSNEIIDATKNAFPIMGEALIDDCSIISTESKEYLKNLPKQAEFNIEGVKILLVHGSPRKNNENITPDLKIEQLEEMLSNTSADLIFCGHTHIPCGYQTNSKQTVVNVGSVGRPFTQEPKSCYVVAEFKDKAFDIKHKLIDYNNQKAAEMLSQRDFKGAESLAQNLIEPSSRHM